MTWFVTGANRGIGYAIVEHLLKDGEKVIGIARNRYYDTIVDLEKRFSNFEVYEINLANKMAISEFIKYFNTPIDVLINNAGVLRREYFPEFNYEDMIYSFMVNTLAALFLTANLYKKGLLKDGAKIINISSQLGSISTASSTPSYSYSITKAALNMVTKLLAHQLREKNIIVISVHPGWVKTDMGRAFAPLSTDESAEGIINLAKKIKLKDSGKFFDYKGNLLEW